MTATLDRLGDTPSAAPAPVPELGPNWYAGVMGTGIVATAAASLPRQLTGVHEFALAVWCLAVGGLVLLTTATAIQWRRRPSLSRSYLRDPVVGHFYGAPPMALLTVGAGTLLLGKDLVGLPGALAVDAVLWGVGTVGGLATLVVLPWRTWHRADRGLPFGGWLMPVVPPMVSATTGALLALHTAGPSRNTLVLGCYVLFTVSLAASAVMIALVVARVVRHGAGPAGLTPTLLIVLGPLGQSVTAAFALSHVVPAGDRAAAAGFALAYAVVVLPLAAAWLLFCVGVLVRTASSRLPFGLPWWSFTFPVGTVVTGISALATRTGQPVIAWAALALYACLVGAWVVVLGRTLASLSSRR